MKRALRERARGQLASWFGARGGLGFGFVQLLFDLFDVSRVHPASHFAQRPTGLLGA